MEAKEESVESDGLHLHKIFYHLSVENDLEGEELEWFKSRISKKTIEEGKKEEEEGKVQAKGAKKIVEVVSEKDSGKTDEKSDKRNLLTMSETHTVWLLSLDSRFGREDAEDVARVAGENEIYEKKKMASRKKCTADAQTPKIVEKSRETLTSEINLKDAVVMASDWDLYDTYGAFDESELNSSKKYLKCHEESSVRVRSTPAEKNDSEMVESSDFTYAALVTERLLASNCYRCQQTVYKAKFLGRCGSCWFAIGRRRRKRDDDEPTDFSCRMEPLWNYGKDSGNPTLEVTDLDWNPLNKDLLAVAYGNLKFSQTASGSVCIWSPKNPRQPEREFSTEESVTCLNHSKTMPNILAAGTKTGKIYVLDVSSRNGCARVLRGSDGWKPPGEPVWKVEWFLRKESIRETEELLSVGENGSLMSFSFPAEKPATGLLGLDYVVSREDDFGKKGSGNFGKRRKRTVDGVVFDRKTFSGLSFSIRADRNRCYVSTREGLLLKCKLTNPSMVEEVFLGHDGPIYSVEHSPVTDLIYLTCGADWTLRIWMEGIRRPLLTLQNKAPVRCAKWSPTIPTMIASICDTELSLWDISRSLHSPVSKKLFRDSAKPMSTLSFSWNGINVVVGGEDGLVRVVHLSQLPKIPFLQKEALIGAIKSGLRKNKELIGVFSRAVEANRDGLKTKVSLE